MPILPYETSKDRLAVYLGCGCFRRQDDGYLAFVRRAYRPPWLLEGEIYRLMECATERGIQFYVYPGTSVVAWQ